AAGGRRVTRAPRAGQSVPRGRPARGCGCRQVAARDGDIGARGGPGRPRLGSSSFWRSTFLSRRGRVARWPAGRTRPERAGLWGQPPVRGGRTSSGVARARRRERRDRNPTARAVDADAVVRRLGTVLRELGHTNTDRVSTRRHALG